VEIPAAEQEKPNEPSIMELKEESKQVSYQITKKSASPVAWGNYLRGNMNRVCT